VGYRSGTARRLATPRGTKSGPNAPAGPATDDEPPKRAGYGVGAACGSLVARCRIQITPQGHDLARAPG
jgi:hypothetical protein